MGGKDEKELDRARNSPANWKRKELDHLYETYGFVIINGSKHDIAKHLIYKDLRATLPRHNSVNKVYVQTAVSIIDEVKKRDGE